MNYNNNSFAEKYRPQFINDISGNPSVIKLFQQFIDDNSNMPNLLLVGPPGTGKTTSILCLARQILKDNFKECVMELNASDDRGIDVVRNKIKIFAQKMVSLPKNKYKIVILDECDNMTTCAQSALRRIMEDYSKSTRFVFLCNYSSQIIEAIHSRCCVIRYKPISNESMNERLAFICNQENIKFTNDGINSIIFISCGDMRKAVNILQAASSYKNLIDEESVNNICDPPPKNIINDIIINSFNTDEFMNAISKIEELCDEGYSALDICNVIFKIVRNIDSDICESDKKIKLISKISYCYINLSNKGTSKIQLCGLLADFNQIYNS
jgi:replication factor C subunit 2/4